MSNRLANFISFQVLNSIVFVVQGILYGSVGFGCGIIGQGIANALMTAKRYVQQVKLDSKFKLSFFQLEMLEGNCGLHFKSVLQLLLEAKFIFFTTHI